MSVATRSGPTVLDDRVVFRLPDPERRLAGVTLLQELQRPRTGPVLERVEPVAEWRATLRRPGVDRMEYLFELRHADGTAETVQDPGNPLSAPGPFGNRSAIEWPEYRPPAWLQHAGAPAGELVETMLDSRILRTSLPLRLWTSAGASPRDALPLLVVHDGFEYAELADLIVLLGHLTTSGAVPAMRAALLAPVDRDDLYSASAAYGRALAHEMLPALGALAPLPPGPRMRVGLGASLGALALLHVHRSHPTSFGSLFLQSGSFFRQRLDKHEAGFPRFGRITRHVGRVRAAGSWPHPIRVAMTCGVAEENLDNNRAMYEALVRQGYDVSLREHRDAHNWVAWRDALEPSLGELLRSEWVERRHGTT